MQPGRAARMVWWTYRVNSLTPAPTNMTGPAEDLSTSSPSHVDPPNAGSHSSETSSTNQTSVKSSSDRSSPAVTGNATPDLCISDCLEINDGYFMPDGTHLTKAGTNRLLSASNWIFVLMPKVTYQKTSPPMKTYAESLLQRKFGATPNAMLAKTQAARDMPGVHRSRNHPTVNATQRNGTAPPAGRPHHELTTPSGG